MADNTPPPNGNDWDEKKARETFEKLFEKVKDKYRAKRPNVLVLGYTGSGKTTLCQAIFGKGIVPDEDLGKDAKPKTMDFKAYEDPDICVFDSRGMELGQTLDGFLESLRKFMAERQGLPSVDDHIHLAWLTVQGCGGKLDPNGEGYIFKHILDPKRTILVITKAEITKDYQKAALLKVATEEIGIPRENIVFVGNCDEGTPTGVKELVERSIDLMPEAYREAFIQAQMVDAERKRQAVLDKKGKAMTIIAGAGASAAAACAVPLPIASGAVLLPIQFGVIASLAALYDVGTAEAMKKAAYPLVARVVGMWAASEVSKVILVFGSILSAAIGSGLTVALGWYVQRQFEAYALAIAEGREPPKPNFDIDELLKIFIAMFPKLAKKVK